MSGASAGPPDPQQFDEAATRLVTTMSSDRPELVTREDFATVVAWLSHWLVRRYQLTEADAEDAAVGAVERLYELAAAPATDERRQIDNPVAYLVTMTRYRAIDNLRRARSASAREAALGPVDAPAVTDDEVAALLDRAASAAEVRAAMRVAVEHGDHLAVRVVGVWLNLAVEQGSEPSSRDVGARARVSHTAVNQALRRFRGYFPRGVSAAS